MSRQLPTTPALSKPASLGTLAAVERHLGAVHRDLYRVLSELAGSVNEMVAKDGDRAMTGPLGLLSVIVADVPDATLYEGSIIYVSNEAGGATVAFSDGINWRRAQDRVIVS